MLLNDDQTSLYSTIFIRRIIFLKKEKKQENRSSLNMGLGYDEAKARHYV